LVLCIHGIAFSVGYSGDNNQTPRKIKFQVAGFVDIAVLSCIRTNNRESYGQNYKQMLAADICDGILKM
jgi:hypothetical protein